MNDTYECSYVEVLEIIKKSEYSCEKKESVYMDNDKEHVYREAGKTFDFKEFFSRARRSAWVDEQYGATVLITSHQAITIPNIWDYTGLHESTQQKIVEVIYNLQNQSKSETERLINQAIQMRLISENGQKKIMIDFPDKITAEQLNLLQAYQNTYGKIVEGFSREYVQMYKGDLPIVLFQDGNGNDNNSHSFEEAVKYAKTLPIIEEQDTPDEIIIGQVISQDASNLCNCSVQQSLKSFAENALDRGVSLESCKGFWRYIKERLNEKRTDR